MSRPVSKVSEVRVVGPLAPFAEEFRVALLAAGYTPLSAVCQLRLMVHVSRWLQARGLAAGDLTEGRIEAYLASRRAAGYRERITRRGLAPLVELLVAQQTLTAERPAAASTAAGRLLASFERYLCAERGLAPSTVSAYVRYAGRFVAGCASDGDLTSVTPADVTGAVLAESTRVSAASAQYFVAGLRSFLRFCHLEGCVGEDLSAAALAVTGRRSSLLPKGISDGDAKALLASCDRRRAIGRRDYAVLVVLLRLGLRGGEVAALRLEDIDWREGQVVVRGKGSRHERLPLPVDVGEAIVGYLRRGRCATTPRREVFVTATAPVRALSREAVSGIVRRACVRAGVAEVGTHRLRHTAACAMVNAGVPLPEIGQALRQRNLTTTNGYARVDITGLRELASPWPGGER